MRTLMLLLIASILAGCAAQDKREPPNWSNIEVPAIPVVDPARLPALCEITVITAEDGTRHGTWSDECWQALEAFELTAIANTDIAKANADALRNTEGAYGSLIKAGEMQQELTDFYNDLLKEEKKGRFYDSVFYRALIAAGLLVIAL